MEVKVLHMNGGEGETSYAKNSSLQMRIIQTARSAVEEVALELCSAASSSLPAKLSVADLGCSSGPNALSVVSSVVDAVEERCRQLGRRPPEFQLFLNDLPGNDFNSLFRSLQAFYEKCEALAGGGGGAGAVLRHRRSWVVPRSAVPEPEHPFLPLRIQPPLALSGIDYSIAA